MNKNVNRKPTKLTYIPAIIMSQRQRIYRKRFGSRPKRFRRTAMIMLGPVYAGK